MRRFALAIALACVLSGLARAGEIPSTGATAQQPPNSMPIAREIHTTGATAPSTLLAIVLTFISIGR